MHPTRRSKSTELPHKTLPHLHPATIAARKKMLAERAAGKHSAPSHRITNASMRETYDGAELRDFDGRPGAMDAFSKPSRGTRC